MLAWKGVTPMQPGGLGGFVKARRKELDMSSQSDLAEAAGVDQKRISNIEQNRTLRSPLPPPDEFAAIATALRVRQVDMLREAGYLSDETGDRHIGDHGDDWLAEQAHLAEMMRPRLQKMALRMIDELIAGMANEEPRQRDMFGGVS